MKKTPKELKELLEEIKQNHKNIGKTQLKMIQKYLNKAYEIGIDHGYDEGADDWIGHEKLI